MTQHETELFLSALVPGAALSRFAFQVFPDDKELDARAAVRFGNFADPSMKKWLVDKNRLGCGCFVALNEFKADAKSRTADNVIGFRVAWLDLDGSPLGPVLDWDHHPHVITETSPGRWHCFWRLKNCPDADHWRAIQTELAEKFDGDRSMDKPGGVMRLPGFWHQKKKPFLSRLHWLGHEIEAIDLCDVFGIKIEKTTPSKSAEPVASHVVLGAGDRNIGLARLGGLVRGAGMDHDEIVNILRMANLRRCNPPLPDREVLMVAKSIMRYPIDRAWTAWQDELDRQAEEWSKRGDHDDLPF